MASSGYTITGLASGLFGSTIGYGSGGQINVNSTEYQACLQSALQQQRIQPQTQTLAVANTGTASTYLAWYYDYNTESYRGRGGVERPREGDYHYPALAWLDQRVNEMRVKL